MNKQFKKGFSIDKIKEFKKKNGLKWGSFEFLFLKFAKNKSKQFKPTDLPIDRNRVCQWGNSDLNWAVPSEVFQSTMIEFINKGI